MLRPSHVWKSEEDKQLRQLADDGASALRIGARLNRTEDAVRRRAVALGITLPTRAETRVKLGAQKSFSASNKQALK